MSSPRRYAYKPLQDAQDIRLLVLEPQQDRVNDEAPIKCHLIMTNFARRPIYQALSYTWESRFFKEETKTIWIDGMEVDVKPNLWSALRHLRQSDRMRAQTRAQGYGYADEDIPLLARCLWIDAICINQEDDLEKNAQVQLMGKIYSLAAHVVVWLGPSADESAMAMESLRYYQIPPVAEEGIDEQKVRELEALDRFFSREYWNRIWIVQEIVLATRIFIYCGLEYVSWRSVSKFRNNYERWASQNLNGVVHIKEEETLEMPEIRPWRPHRDDPELRSLLIKILYSTVMRLDHERTIRSTGRPTLSDLIKRFQHCQSSDRRDKVIALLSLADDCKDGQLVLDYTKSTIHLYEDVLLFHQRNLASDLTPDLVHLSMILQRTLGLSAQPVSSELTKLKISVGHPTTQWKLRGSFCGVVVKSLAFTKSSSPYKHFKDVRMSDLFLISAPQDHNMNVRITGKTKIGARNIRRLPENRTYWKDLFGAETLLTPHYRVGGPQSEKFDAEWRAQNLRVFQSREYGQLNSQYGIARQEFRTGDVVYNVGDDSGNFTVILRKEVSGWMYVGRTIMLNSTNFSMGKNGKMEVEDDITSEEFVERQIVVDNLGRNVVLHVDTLGLAHLTR